MKEDQIIESPLLKPGLTQTNKNPQRYKRRCRNVTQRKIRWVTEEDALIALTRLGGTGHVYYHKDCGAWHVTSQKRKEKNK